MALALEFDHNEMRIRFNTRKESCEEACRVIFSRWLNGKISQPVSWKRLIIALKDIEFGTLASNLDESLSPSS